jgi:hypothetical protein
VTKLYCYTIDCGNYREGSTAFCSSCNRANRKAESEARKPSKLNAKIKKMGRNQRMIKEGLTIAYALMDSSRFSLRCDAYPTLQWDDHDHTISQKRCKELGKTELIGDYENIEYSSRKAHMEWESYKSGLFVKHANFDRRMAFVKEHDPEGWEKRMAVVRSMDRLTETI